MSLKQKTIKGIAYRTLQTFLQRGLNLVSSIVLARLIAPEEFGVMAILMVFQAISQVLIQGGFGAALIQKKTLTQEDQNAVFFFNITVAFVIFCFLFAIAPWIASFYAYPVLESAMRVFSAGFLISSFGAVQATMLTRDLRFRAHMIISLGSAACSAAVSITMAMQGFGVWALVYGGVVNNVVATLGQWFYGRWTPSLSLDVSALRGLFGFSSKMLALTLIGQVTEQMYALIIGKFYPAATLGFFHRARNFRQLSVQSFAQPMNDVFFPTFSKLQHDKNRLKRAFLESLDSAMVIFVPLVLGLGAVANQLIPLLYGERWLPAAEYFQILCWAVVFMPATNFHSSLIKALGRPGLRLKAELIVSPATLVLIVCSAPFGVMAMVWTSVVQGWFWAAIMIFFSRKVIDVPLVDEVRLLLRSLLLGGTMYFGVRYLPHCLPDMARLWMLLIQGFVGILLYGLLVRICAAKTLRQLLKNFEGVVPSGLLKVAGRILAI